MRTTTRLFLALGAAVLAAGCATSPDERVVGVYSLDPVRTEVPEFPAAPALERQVRMATRNVRFKLRTDRTFVLATGARAIEGNWTLEDGVVRLTTKDKAAVRLLSDKDGQIEARIADDNDALILERTTPVGKVLLYMRKTG